MTTLIRLSGIALIGLFASLLLKEKHKAAGIGTVVTAFILIWAITVKNEINTAVETVRTYASDSDFSQHAEVLLKALGIAYITSATGAICRDGGEQSLSMAVELSGKAQIMMLSFPLISALIEIAADLI